jgi:hypothetical protein
MRLVFVLENAALLPLPILHGERAGVRGGRLLLVMLLALNLNLYPLEGRG